MNNLVDIQNTVHPYPRGLLSSTVHGARRGARLVTIPGTPPSLDKELESCAFAPRCQLVERKCTEREPPNIRIAEHFARCVRAESAPPGGV